MIYRTVLDLRHLNIEEARRYACGGEDGETTAALEDAAAEVLSACAPVGVYGAFPVSVTPEGAVLGESGLILPGKDMGDLFRRCHTAVVFAVTLGQPVEQLLRRYSVTKTSRALLCDACASSAVESACDLMESVLREQYPNAYFSDRFSPGYGDLPLTIQKPLCALLDIHRKIGVAVSGSGLLIPRKTVTAVLGLSDKPQATPRRGCFFCPMNKTCKHRKIE